MQLYKRLFSSVGPLVRQSIGMSRKVGKRVFQRLGVYVSVLEGGLGGVLGVDEGWLPLPTRPQQYCGPASLVSFCESFGSDGPYTKKYFLLVNPYFV